jgi:pSer/pThr/pTyr-binding forkhead associated (FHA) protein
MIRSYIVIEKGLLEERVYPLEKKLTIGRRPTNDIYLSDPSVSRQHAEIVLEGGRAVVRDLGSHNGTFLNGERVEKAPLSNGDTIQIGGTLFRFVQERVEEDRSQLLETQEIPESEVSLILEGKETSRRSRRLIEALSKVPLFERLDDKALETVAQAAHLVVFDRGRTIIRQGDRGKSLFILLDGKVRVYTYDQRGKEVPLAILSENQFFGEMSLLTGAPRSASVQALEESLLCEISYEAMREIVQKWPSIKKTLEDYYRQRLADMEQKKRDAGMRERRRHPRLNERLPVSFSVSPTSPGTGLFRRKVFRSISQDISISGIRIRVQENMLRMLPVGSHLRLEITLPPPWGTIRCLGILRNVMEVKEGQGIGYLGVEFLDLPPAHRKKLERFIFR